MCAENVAASKSCLENPRLQEFKNGKCALLKHSVANIYIYFKNCLSNEILAEDISPSHCRCSRRRSLTFEFKVPLSLCNEFNWLKLWVLNLREMWYLILFHFFSFKFFLMKFKTRKKETVYYCIFQFLERMKYNSHVSYSLKWHIHNHATHNAQRKQGWA